MLDHDAEQGGKAQDYAEEDVAQNLGRPKKDEGEGHGDARTRGGGRTDERPVVVNIIEQWRVVAGQRGGCGQRQGELGGMAAANGEKRGVGHGEGEGGGLGGGAASTQVAMGRSCHAAHG